MRNPLNNRIIKNLLGDWKKNLMIMVLMIVVIGFVSGMYVANHSMLETFRKAEADYNIEDGHFELREEASKEMLEDIEKGELSEFDMEEDEDDPYEQRQVTIYENYFKEATEYLIKDSGDTDGEEGKTKIGNVRLYQIREEVNLASVNSGRLPENEKEIAIDRMHADNIEAEIGDTIAAGDEEFEIVGLVALPDYQVLLENTTDIMFDAISFDVAILTEEGFERVEENVHYNYSWLYTTKAGNGVRKTLADDNEAYAYSNDFVKAVSVYSAVNQMTIEEYVPAYASTAIHFAEEDMGSDEAMGGVLLYIFIMIFAFIFAMTCTNTIEKDAAVIGTLRASGYTKGELTAHYMASPIIIVLLAALIGNVLGYTVFKDVVVGMYYNSYSLPPYVTVVSTEALWKTTVIPIIIMIIINFVVIRRSLQATPLQFLRSDFKRKGKKKSFYLPKKWKFIRRFRLRVLFQNVAGYLVIFVGILFVMVMLAMAVGMPEVLRKYQDQAEDMMIADYQMILKQYEDGKGERITTETEGAEAYGMMSLDYEGTNRVEEISVYGMSEDSMYMELPDVLEDEVVIGSAFADKYNIKQGDTITLDAQYTDDTYTFTAAEIVDYEAGLAVFLPLEDFVEAFDLEEDYFTGYFSDVEIDDIDEDYILKTIVTEDIVKMAAQLDHSMGAYMAYFQYVLVIVSFIMIYLLTKLIIEKNENAISMTKIFGYEVGEIARLYLIPTSVVVLVSVIITSYLGQYLMGYAWRAMLMDMNGYYRFEMSAAGQLRMMVIVMVSYLLVAVVDFIRIRRIPMDVALKNVE